MLSSARIKSPVLADSPIQEFQEIREDEEEADKLEQQINRDLNVQADFEELPVSSAKTMQQVFYDLQNENSAEKKHIMQIFKAIEGQEDQIKHSRPLFSTA